jgi:hypothetical protein
MKLTEVSLYQWSTYVGILTEEQKDLLVGNQFTDDSLFNPIQDKWDNWIISVEEMAYCTNEPFLWVKDLDLIPYEPKEYPPLFGI